MFKIGDFSKLSRVPVSALRYYADIGLLQPAHVDTFSGYRYYTIEQLPRLNRILALRDLGLSLEQIGRVLSDDVSPAELRGMLRMKQLEIQHQIDDEQARLARVAARLALIEQEGIMPTQEVTIKTLEPQRVLAIREIVPQPSDVGNLIGQAYMAMGAQGLQPVAPPIAIFHDEEFKPANLDVEIALAVDAGVRADVPVDGNRHLTLKELPAVAQAACILHMGDYDNFAETYGVLGQWISANGYHFAGPSREVYLTSPDDESGAVTEIQFPVAR